MTPSTPVDQPGGGPLPWIAAVVTVVLWSSAFVGIRYATESFSPGALTLARTATAAAVLTVAVAARAALSRRRVTLPSGRTLVVVVLWGIGWFGLYNLALNTAEQHLDAGTTALVVNLAPVIVVVLAGVFLNEGFPRRLLLGVVIAFGGVAIIAAGSGLGGATPIGVLLALASAAIYGVCATTQKSVGRRVDPLTMTWIGCLMGVLTSLPFAPELITRPLEPGPAAVAVYLGVFPTAVAFLTWGYALRRLPAGRLATSTYVSPALAIILAWILLAEPPGPLSLLGGALCLTGVAVATLGTRRARPAAPGPNAAVGHADVAESNRPHR